MVERLDMPVILQYGYAGYKKYGIMEITKDPYKSEIGSIVENLLQDDIRISFKTEEEKEKIISIIPKDFQISFSKNTIIISFDKKEIEAPLYLKNEERDYYGRSHTEFRELGMGKIVGTEKTPELTERISKLMSTIHQIKAEIYKADEKKYNADKIKASSDIQEFFYWLNKTGEIEILHIGNESGEVSMGPMFAARDIKRSYTDKYIYYKFPGDETVYEAYEPDSDWVSRNRYGEKIEELYNKFVKEMKENGEYYVKGTQLAKNEVSKKNAVYSQNKDAIILKDGELCLTVPNAKVNFYKKFCISKEKGSIYVATKYESQGYEKVDTATCLIGKVAELGKNVEQLIADKFWDMGWLISLDTCSYYGVNNEIRLGKDDDEKIEPQVFQLKGTKSNDKEFYKGIVMCRGKEVAVICDPGDYSEENLITYEYDKPITSIEAHNNYVVINNSDVIIIIGERYSKGKVKRFTEVQNLNNINAEYLSGGEFISNENGCFCVANFSEKQKLELYEKYGFTKLYEKLNSSIQQREVQKAKKREEHEKNDKKLNEYVSLASSVLVPVVFSNPDESMDMHGALIHDADTHKSINAYYYRDNPKVQALYGIQEKGWEGYAYRGFIIDVECAKKLVKDGKLHLDVPKEAMGKVIGSKGSNISAVTKALREKGVDVSKIILHEKTPEEMKIKLAQIKESIEKNKQKGQGHED